MSREKQGKAGKSKGCRVSVSGVGFALVYASKSSLSAYKPFPRDGNSSALRPPN